MSGASVSAGYAKAVVDVAVARGADRVRLIAGAGFDPDTCLSPDDRVPFDVFKALIRVATAETGPAFPLHFGAESHFREISVVGLITYASATMGEAFEQLNRFARLAIEVEGHDRAGRFALARRDGEVWIEDIRPNPGDFPELTESTFARFIWTTSRHFGDVPFAKRVCFTHPEPAHSAEHRRLLGVPVAFGCDRNAIAIHESWLSLPLPNANRYVFGIFADRGEMLLDELLRSKSLRGQVEASLLARLHTGDLGMAGVARELGHGRTSLYRKLKVEGVSYDRLVDDLRHRMALRYLAGRRASVGEVAYLVGFSDPASFSRAFKRWTGSTPGSVA